MKSPLRAGLIEEVGTQPKRGALEHFYRAVGDDFTTLLMIRSRRLAAVVAALGLVVAVPAAHATADPARC